MVSVLSAPRPADFRPNIWPANWQLWRHDDFTTPGTLYDPAMWLRYNDHSALADFPLIEPTPDGPGIRFIADVVDVDGTPTPRSSSIISGPGNLSGSKYTEYGADGLNSLGQVYTPPFMMTFWERYAPKGTWSHGYQGTWLVNPGFPVRVPHYGVDVAATGNAPLDEFGQVRDDFGLTIELDGSELSLVGNTNHTQSFWSISNNWESLGNTVNARQSYSPYAGTSPNEWYQVSYLVYRDHNGDLRVMSQIKADRRTTLWNQYIIDAERTDGGGKVPDRAPYHDALFEKMPFNVSTGCWATSGWYGGLGGTPGASVGESRWMDMRDFRVYLPPGDPRLSQPFKSNSPGAAVDVPPFWSIAGSIAGNTLNVTITDGQPRANWSVSVVEDDPFPSPPVTASGNTNATAVRWALGTTTFHVPGINISSLDPTKGLEVSVTHGGRTQVVVVTR